MAQDLDISRHLEGLARHGYPYRRTEDGKTYLSLPERLPYEPDDAARIHVCKGAERLMDLAIMYFPRDPNAIDRAIVIGQYQEDPIIDPFVPLLANRIVMIPSESYFQGTAYGESLTDDPEF